MYGKAILTQTLKHVNIGKVVQVELKVTSGQTRGRASNRLQAPFLMQASSWLRKHQSLISAAYVTAQSVRGGLDVCTTHLDNE